MILMGLFGFLSRLPIALLISSFTVAAAGAPVQRDGLTEANFKTTIADGLWLVEHYSPYCSHCKKFAPTWDKLVANTESLPDPGIHLAQVNCAVSGDLCNDNKITGYPHINLYRNGEFVETYNEAREFGLMITYISKHAESTSPVATSSSYGTAAPSTTATNIPHIQTQRATANPTGTVLSLNEKNFQQVVDQGPVFIKFFAPWCGHCKKLAPKWTQLAEHMKHKLNVAEVNCEANAALCKAQNIEGYPMLMFYSSGASSEYTGGRNFEQLRAFSEKAASPSAQELVVDQLDSHVQKNPVVYLLLYSVSDNHILNQVIKASGALLGTPPVFTSTSPELFKRFKILAANSWALISLTDLDAYSPAAILTSSASTPSTSELNSWLFSHRLPTAIELKQETFQDVMNAPHHPLVVIAAVSHESIGHVAEKMRAIAASWRDRGGGNEVVFTWMDAERWAKWMKSMYGIRVTPGVLDPPIVVADHSRLMYYDKDVNDKPILLSSASLLSTVEGIQKGSIAARHSENIFERAIKYLNTKIVLLENFVVNHTFYAFLCFCMFVFLLFLGVRRMIDDSASYDYRQEKSKSTRLD